MSYSFGTVVESADYDDVYDNLLAKFAENYPTAEDVLKDGVKRVVSEVPYLAQEFLSATGQSLPDDHTLNITLSGHEHVTENDAAPRYVSVTITLNKKPEPTEAEAGTDDAEAEAEEPAEDEEPVAVAAGAGKKGK
jgi:hypothetical protein